MNHLNIHGYVLMTKSTLTNEVIIDSLDENIIEEEIDGLTNEIDAQNFN